MQPSYSCVLWEHNTATKSGLKIVSEFNVLCAFVSWGVVLLGRAADRGGIFLPLQHSVFLVDCLSSGF
jgi:hypothetical protein